MNIHSKVHIIFFLLNSCKNQFTCHFLPASQKNTGFSLRTPGSDSASDVTGDLSCTANRTAFSTSEIGFTQNATQIFEVPWKIQINLIELFCFDKFQFWYI